MLGPLLKPDLQELIQTKSWDALRGALSHFDPSDIAEILIAIPDQDDVAIFRILPRELAGRVFSYLPLDHQTTLIRCLSNDQMRQVLSGMTPDDQTRLLEELPAAVTRRVLETLSPQELNAARDLLGYPPGTAGRYMTPRYVALSPNLTAQQALEHVRRTGRGQETLNILYVVDEEGKLLKELRLGSLVLADPHAKVIDLQDRPLVFIPSTADSSHVLSSFKKYDRAALPVTDADGHMLGIITADDVLDVGACGQIERAGRAAQELEPGQPHRFRGHDPVRADLRSRHGHGSSTRPGKLPAPPRS
jgi:magnesium transporter